MLTDFQREKYWVKWMAPLEGKHCHRQEKQPCLSFTNWGNQQILGMLYSDRAQEMQPQESSLNFPFSQLSTSPEYVYQMGGGKCKKKRQLPSIPWFVYLSGSWEISPVQHPGFLRLERPKAKWRSLLPTEGHCAARWLSKERHMHPHRPPGSSHGQHPPAHGSPLSSRPHKRAGCKTGMRSGYALQWKVTG